MSILANNSFIRRNPELVSSDLDGETVMMSIESGEYFGLDSVGSRIWELLETPTTVANLVDILVDEFEVSREECEADTIDFLNQLLDKHLLVVEPLT